MRNMDYEQKYKAALDWARKVYPHTCGKEKEDLELFFPELKESEDERIRKHIIEILERLSPCHWDGNEKSECIAYLEKQKEQKLISFNESYNPDDYEVVMKGNATSLKRKEQKPSEWSEEDEKYLNLAINIVASDFGEDNPTVSWLKSLRPQLKHKQEEVVLHWESGGHPEPYRSVLILRHGNVVVEGEWNEETGRWYQYGFQSYLEDNEVEGWMDKKSLLSCNFNPQPHWKPSKGQIDALNSIILTGSFTYVGQVQDLISLKDELEKLM